MNSKKSSSWLALVLCFVFVGTLYAAINRVPTTTVGAAYFTTPSTLANGDYDSLQTDASHNLFVNVRAGGGVTPGTTSPTPFTTTNSNGATAASIRRPLLEDQAA